LRRGDFAEDPTDAEEYLLLPKYDMMAEKRPGIARYRIGNFKRTVIRMYKRILFVCTGNTCRSPMAEGLFRLIAEREGLDVDVRSAGVAAMDGFPISGHAADILKEKGFTDTMRSSALTAERVEWSDLILTMTAAHKQIVIQRFPDAADKVFTLKEFAEDDQNVLEALAERQRLSAELEMKRSLGQPVTEEETERLKQIEATLPDFDVADPFGGTFERYVACSQELETYLNKLAQKLKQ